MNLMNNNSSEIIIYQTEDGQTKIDVRMENDFSFYLLITKIPVSRFRM